MSRRSARLLLLAAGALLGWSSLAAAALSMVKGPYLQRVTTSRIVIMWQTSVPSDSRVDYGTVRPYPSSRYDATPREIHEIQLTGLGQDMLYYYRVSSQAGAEVVTSADSTFRTAPAMGTPFRFVVYGDSRTDATAHAAVIQGIIASAPRFVLHTGDFCTDGTNAAQWQSDFFLPAEPLIQSTPLFPCKGNHEDGSDLYYQYFATPVGGGSYGESWYSFDYGDCHFAVLNTNKDFAPGSAQYTWLANDLQTTAAEWRFVVQHHPAYSSGNHGGHSGVQTYLVPLYEAYRVDAVFAGHDHDYERSYKNGVYYLVTGGGGAPLYPVNVNANPYQQYATTTYHHCVVDLSGATATITAHHNDGSVFDSVTLTHAPPTAPAADFSGTPTSGAAPLTVMFTDASTGTPTSWSWAFGDGGVSTAQHPSHLYSAAGTYTVGLTVANAVASHTETKLNYVTATAAPSPQSYSCASITLHMGAVTAGNHTSVHSSDNSYLVMTSVPWEGKQVTQVAYNFTTGLTSLSSLAVTVETKATGSTPTQTVYAYNHVGHYWDARSRGPAKTADRTITFTLPDPDKYFANGEVNVLVRMSGTNKSFTSSTDLVRIAAAP